MSLSLPTRLPPDDCSVFTICNRFVTLIFVALRVAFTVVFEEGPIAYQIDPPPTL